MQRLSGAGKCLSYSTGDNALALLVLVCIFTGCSCIMQRAPQPATEVETARQSHQDLRNRMQARGFAPVAEGAAIWKQTDLVEGYTWYVHEAFWDNPWEIYIGTREEEKWLRIVFALSGPIGVTLDEAIFVGNGEIIPIEIPPRDEDSAYDSEHGITRIYADTPLKPEIRKLLEPMVSGPFTIRIRGSNLDKSRPEKGCPPCIEIFDFYDSLPERTGEP